MALDERENGWIDWRSDEYESVGCEDFVFCDEGFERLLTESGFVDRTYLSMRLTSVTA